MADAMDTVAKKFPNTKFAIIDFDATDAEGQADQRRGPAVQGAGGGLPRRLPRGPVRQGQGRHDDLLGRRPEDPAGRPLHRRLPGGRQGGQPGDQDAQRLLPGLRRPGKCKEIALNQIPQGSQVVFQVAGQCGLGALDAAKEKGVQGIGVDADQAYLGPQVLTSRR